MSLVWGKIVHPLTGYSILHPGGALLVTSPPEKGTYYAHPLPPPIVGLLFPSAVRALIFIERSIHPFLSLVDREVEFCVLL